jgi:membrane protein implicated in regulation of membrane protease activity
MNETAVLAWLGVGLFVCVLEVTTGTFYLLAIGVALIETAFIAWLGGSITAHFLVASVLILLNIVIVHRLKKKIEHQPQAIKGNNLEAGQLVEVLDWKSKDLARVHYRGTEWDARLQSPEMPQTNRGYVQAIEGNHLIISTTKEL